MRQRYVSAVLSASLLFLAVLTTGCRDETPTAPTDAGSPPALFDEGLLTIDGELFGNVYEGGSRTNRNDLFFDLVPDQETQNLIVEPYDESFWVVPADTGSSWGIEYIYPGAGGDCGSISQYPYPEQREYERHRSGPGQGVPSGREAHCIVPGTYHVSLLQGGQVVSEFDYEYHVLAKDGAQPVTVYNPDRSRLDRGQRAREGERVRGAAVRAASHAGRLACAA